MRKLNVLVFDDESPKGMLQRIRKFGFLSAQSLSTDALIEQLDILTERQKLSRKPKANKTKLAKTKSLFDTVDILIVDYDLIEMRKAGVLTGEEVAYLVRCYSTCKIIVAVNQFFRTPTFDLTLRGHFDSFADVNVCADDLENKGLWEPTGKGYRPWYWPRLTILAEQMLPRTEQVSNSQKDLLGLLGVSMAASDTMSADVLSPIWDGKRALLADEFVDAHGLRGADKIYLPSRDLIVASRFGKWVRTLLLPGQDIVVDAPHLVERCPNLLLSKPTISALNRTTGAHITRLGIHHRLLSQHAVTPHWTPVPTWKWTSLEKDKTLHATVPELAEPWKRPPIRFAFCEDTSAFRLRTKTQSFVADLRSGYNRRTIERVPRVQYRPELRLAM